MDQTDFFWVVGFMEGEGSFLKGPPSAPNTPRMSTLSVDADIIKRIASLFEINYICERKDKRNPKWKTIFTVMKTGKKAIRLMVRMYPYMTIRRQEQIRGALEKHPDIIESLDDEKKELNDDDHLHYLAGYLEGEGSFLKAYSYDPNQPAIQVTSTDLDCLTPLAELFEVSVRGPFHRKNSNSKPYYTVKKKGYPASQWMKKLQPLMGERRQGQIQAALDNFVFHEEDGQGRGRNNSQAKLDPDAVRAIRQAIIDGSTLTALSKYYKVDIKTISFIRDRKTWAWVE